MSFLSKILGREEESKAAVATAVCPHTVLLPRWDSIEDMGKEDRATGYTCQSCTETFSPDEAKAVRQASAERLRIS